MWTSAKAYAPPPLFRNNQIFHDPPLPRVRTYFMDGPKCCHDLLVNKCSHMIQFWAEMSYLGGHLVPFGEVTD